MLRTPTMYIPDFRGQRGLLGTLKDLYLRVFGLPFLQRRIEARYVFRRSLRIAPGDIALDVGSGDALFTVELAKRGAVAYGVDVETRDVTRGQARIDALGLQGKIHLQVADGQRLPFDDAFFHHVVSNCTIEHIPDDDETLREIYRVLKPGGHVSLTVPADAEEDERTPVRLLRWALRRSPEFKRRWFRPWTIPHATIREFCTARLPNYYQVRYGYGVDELRAKLERAGFEVTDWRPHLRTFGIFGSDCIDALGLFEIVKTHSGPFGFAAKHEWVYAATFPFFYALSLLDEVIPSKGFTGFGITGRKPSA